MPSCLKEMLIRPILMKTHLATDDLNNYRTISNLPFLGKLIERVVANQLGVFLEETDNLDAVNIFPILLLSLFFLFLVCFLLPHYHIYCYMESVGILRFNL